MAEEGKAKLNFPQVFVQAQGALGLRCKVSNKLGKGNILSEKTTVSAELKVLLEKCTDSSFNVSLECCSSLVSLVRNGEADLQYVLTKFLNILPTASNKSSVVQSIAHLLAYQVFLTTTQNGIYHCPYGIRKQPHPFITIITQQPTCGAHLLEQVELLMAGIYCNSDYSNLTNIFQMLKPFVVFVLADPRSSTDYCMRYQLQSVLLESISALDIVEESPMEDLRTIILGFLIDIMIYYKVDQESIGQTSTLIHQLAKWILGHIDYLQSSHITSQYMNSLITKIVDQLLSLTSSKLHNGVDIMSTLLLLQKLQNHYPEVFAKSKTVWMLNVLLVESPVVYLYQILTLWKGIVSNFNSRWSIRCSSLGASLPLLQMMSTHTSSSLFTKPGNLKQLASKCFMNLEPFNHSRNKPDGAIANHQETSSDTTIMPSQLLVQMETCAQIADRIMRDDKGGFVWISSLKSSMASCDHIPSHVSLLLSLLLVKPSEEVCSEALEVIKMVVKISPSQSLWFLPLFLHKLSQEPEPDLKLKILYAVPDLATHKIVIGPVLKTIQSLSTSPSLRSITLRLLLNLWYQQNRVFPHLQKALLSDDHDVQDHDMFVEIQISKAATIRDICKHRPQHGPDLLGALSSLIDNNIKVEQSFSSVLVVPLALDGIKHLCGSEVVDLCTAWQVLAVKLSQDKRPVIIKALCELFSLIPSLETDGERYQEFKEEALSYLWKATMHEIPSVVGSAFKALAKFDVKDFKLCHIPESISKPIKTKLLSSKKTTEETLPDIEHSIVMSSPPGCCYMSLMASLHEETLLDYQEFLTSLIQQESSSIPRGVVYNATKINQSHGRTMTGIPSFLKSQYEKSKTPGLNMGLAVGLLFSYQPPFEEHEGKRARRYHLNCARSYKHMLDSLLHEVPIQPSEWHRNLLLPQAWTLFMTRLYNACVLGRKEEIAMQLSRGHIEDKQEADEKQNNAWLRTRDTLTEQLQSASRGNPSVQGNSVLALAGLAVAVSSYISQQANKSNQSDESDVIDERQRTRDWLCVIADTLMTVLDGNYKARTAPLTWCQQVSSPTSTASSLLARSCAALSLSQMVPVLVTLDPDRIKVFSEALKSRVPGQAKAGSSSVIQVHCSLGLGLMLSKLYEEHFSELAGNEGYIMMTTALDALENAAFSQDLENTEGASLGIGLALSSLCKENIVDSRVHLLSMHQQLKTLLHSYDKEANRRIQTLAFSFSLVTGNAYHAGIVTEEEVHQCLNLIEDLCTKYNEAAGMSLSLGLLIHSLLIVGMANINEKVIQQLAVWEASIDNKDLSSLQRLAAVNGLMGLLGSEQGFFQVESTYDDLEAVVQGKGISVLKTLKSLVSSPHDVGLSSNIAWLLGHVYSASTSSSITRTSVPTSYSYLPETSILRSTFDFLVEAGKTGPHLKFSGPVVKHVLVALVTGCHGVLPPVNWASVLGPIMRSEFGNDASRLCLQFAVNQANSSSSLMSFLSSWLSPGLFCSLQSECQKELFQSLSKLIFVVPSARIQEFLKGPLIAVFKNFDPLVCEAILVGVLSSLKVRDPPQSVFGWLCTAVKQIYETLPQDRIIENENVLKLLANCLVQNSLEKVDHLTQMPNQNSVAIRCHLVSSRQAPIKWLNICVTWLLDSTNQPSESNLILWTILVALFKCRESKTEDRLSWFMDVISQIRVTATDSQESDRQIQSLSRGLTLLSGIAVNFSKSNLTLDLELDVKQENSKVTCEDPTEIIDRSLKILLRLLSCSLVNLMRIEEWRYVTDKVLEWLFVVRGSSAVQASGSLQRIIEECIVAFKDSKPFQKISIWTEALSKSQRISC